MTDPAVEAVARLLCVGRGIDPDRHEPGLYTIPYDADYIGEDNTQCDGEEGSLGDNYREPRSFCWRHQGANAMRIIDALREQGWGPITPEMKAVCEAARDCVAAKAKNRPGLEVTLIQKADALGRALLKEDGK